MHRILSTCLMLGLLSACAGLGTSASLDDVPQLDDVSLSADSAAIAAPDDAPGFFAQFFGQRETPPDNPPEPDAASETPAASSPGILGRLLGGGGASATAASSAGTVPPLTNQPFGEVGVTCGLSRRDMGTEIYATSGYKLYDTFPNSTAPRPHYVTGFKDGCARQFTAALVLVGDVGTHEVVRYETAQSRRPYTKVDNAYEAIKSSFCRAGFGKPCGSRINALARNTTFITGYERFSSSPTWMEILLHAGEVAAVSTERK